MGESRAWVAPACVFLLALAGYVATLHPSVPGGDSGELIAVAYRLEVAHPPGYPLYTLLAKLFTLLPLRTVAWRVNLLSAVLDAGAAALICATVAAFARAAAFAAAAAAGVLAGLLFAFSPLIWRYATGAEVFALNNFFAALIFHLAFRWRQSRDVRVAYALAFTLGLGLTNHHTLAFYALPTAVWLLWDGRAELVRGPMLARLVGAGAAGLLPYVYLWLAAGHATTLSWGDTATLRGFADHLLRRDYGTFQLAAGAHAAPTLAAQLAVYGVHVAGATLWVGLAFAVAGLAAGMRVARSWTVLLVVCLALYLGVFLSLANLPVDDPLLAGVLARFWQQADVVVFLLAGAGFAAAAQTLPARLRGGVAFATAAALILVGSTLSFPEADHHDDDIVARYGRILLAPLPQGALLLTRGDLITNVTRYLQACEDLRTDVVVLDQELMTKPWYVARAARQFPRVSFPAHVYDPRLPDGFSMRAFLEANGGFEVFLYPEWKTGDASVEGAYETWPVGLASRVARAQAGPPIEQWRAESAKALEALQPEAWPAIKQRPPGTWERVVLEDVWQARHRHAVWLLTKAMEPGADMALLANARSELEAAKRSHPEPPWYVYKNLGIVYERLVADGARKLAALQLSAWEEYLRLAPSTEAAYPAIAAAVERLRAAGAATQGSKAAGTVAPKGDAPAP